MYIRSLSKPGTAQNIMGMFCAGMGNNLQIEINPIRGEGRGLFLPFAVFLA